MRNTKIEVIFMDKHLKDVICITGQYTTEGKHLKDVICITGG